MNNSLNNLIAISYLANKHMQYQVPQFIETEDTIIGSLTLRQFIYLAVGGSIIMTAYLF